jgi:hypothetical protein
MERLKMAIDVLEEDLIELADAPAVFEQLTKHRPHIATIYRWCDEEGGGLDGIVLETVPVGRKRYTSREAINKWCQARAGKERPAPPLARKARLARRKRSAQTDAILARAGI